MRTRAHYDHAFASVREVIHEWDPYWLLRGGAPDCEWDREIALLVTRIPRIKSTRDAIMAVSEVFSDAFRPEDFPPKKCHDVGHALFEKLQERAWLIFDHPPEWLTSP